MRASSRATNPDAERKQNGFDSSLPEAGRFVPRGRLALSADLDFLERFEQEHARRDPKDRELWAARSKPGETLVEDRSVTDVQIVRRSHL